MRLDTDEYQRVLGEELRELRKQRGWTRRELGERLTSDISLQTLATYELGTRHCSVVRLVELCLALDEQPQALLSRVQNRVYPAETGNVRVSLRALAALHSAELAPLRRWAQGQLQRTESPPAEGEVQLDRNAIGWLAQLCGTDAANLTSRLRQLSVTS